MYDKILIPLDGSKLGEAAIPAVNEIISGARESRKIEITLLQIVPNQKELYAPSVAWPGEVVNMNYIAVDQEQIKKRASDYLETVGKSLKNDPNVTVRMLVKVGDDPAEEILKASDELKIDLIAISTHGRSGLTRWAYGSVADRILRGGNTPVLMVRAGKPNR
jgi:nucleotide-binding universal stress UspA family protein